MMTQGTLKIHSENILPIIKKWLYSEKDIFVRELVSNATDAISKVRKLTEHKSDDSYRIDITIDKDKKTISFQDNGIGMTSDEVEKYIAQLAFSGAEEFMSKYASNNEEDTIIGHFGLGFYSAYMVAEKVEIETLSYLPNQEPVFWSCDGSSTYFIDKGERKTQGTNIILYIQKTEEEYLDPVRLREMLSHYCAFLPYPIFLNGSQINEKPPLWLKNPVDCTDKEYIDFYHLLFPQDPSPLFWIHLNVDFPFHLKGILYFPKLNRDGDLKKETIKLYCNRVFVSDQCKDLLPDYLMILKGALDSTDIPLNVSRSYLQVDKTVKQVGNHIAKKITDRLSILYKTQKEQFLAYWDDIEVIVKFGILQDDKFYEKAKEFLVWKNSSGEWTTIEEYIERNQGKTAQTIFYAPEDKSNSAFLDFYQEKGHEVLLIKSHMLDQALIAFLERKSDVKFSRIDASIHDTLIDHAQEKGLLDESGKTEGGRIAEFFKRKLGLDHLNVEAKSLASNAFPGFILMKEEERRFRDSLAFQNKEIPGFSQAFMKPTFVVNTNHKLINAIFSLEKRNPELAKDLATSVYDLALLSQKEMAPEALGAFINKNITVLEKLVSLTEE